MDSSPVIALFLEDAGWNHALIVFAHELKEHIDIVAPLPYRIVVSL
jgi:hypothetical protein